MDDYYPYYEEDEEYYYEEAASTPARGGCFSTLLTLLLVIFGLFGFFRLTTGETSRPWELTIELAPVHAKAPEDEAAIESSAQSSNQSSSLAPFFAPSVLYWEDDIIRWADDFGIDPNLLATVMQIESCGDPHATSHAGAMGLFQVMPYHFAAGEDPYKPNINAKRGIGYLEKALQTYNSDIRLAFASYNGGIGTAAKAEIHWPQETIRYVHWGTGIYDEASKGKQNSTRLDEWMGAGGYSLCNQANEALGITP